MLLLAASALPAQANAFGKVPGVASASLEKVQALMAAGFGARNAAIHEMLDPQVESVRAMVDATAERIARLGEIDPVSEDLLLGQSADLELFQWFIRAHLESSRGQLASADATSEKEAARAGKAVG